jgi:hypothetical protein
MMLGVILIYCREEKLLALNLERSPLGEGL